MSLANSSSDLMRQGLLLLVLCGEHISLAKAGCTLTYIAFRVNRRVDSTSSILINRNYEPNNDNTE
jgi:hypothetical protein